MLDTKVIAAVFATLAAVAAAMNGGTIDANGLDSVKNPTDQSFKKFVPDQFDVLDRFMKKPEPENSVSAEVKVEDLHEQSITVKASRLHVQNLSATSFGSKTVKSDGNISFYGYNGDIKPAETTEVKGRADGMLTSGVNISGNTRVREELQTGFILLKNVKRSAINLKGVEGRISSNSTTTRITDPDTNLKINSFSGRLEIRPGNNTVTIDGKVDRLDAGPVSFGQ